VNDVAVTKIIEPDQTVIILAGDGYIAVEIHYGHIGIEEFTSPDVVILLGLDGAWRMMAALGTAATMVEGG
jgi:hypothetical protein